MFIVGEEINGGEKVLKAQRFVSTLVFVSSFYLPYIINLFPSLLLSIILMLYTKNTPFFMEVYWIRSLWLIYKWRYS